MLSWVVYALRPLTIYELQVAIAVQRGSSTFDIETTKSGTFLLSICAGLVHLENATQYVRLIHYSAQEYLLRHGNFLFPDVQHEITTTCLTYMSLDIWQDLNCSSRKDMANLQDKYPFYEYAARYWGTHARGIPERDVIVANFLNSQHHQFCSFQSRSLSERGKMAWKFWLNDENTLVPLLHASEFGLLYTVAVLLGKHFSLKHTTSIRRFYGRWLDAFLQAAVANGHLELTLFWLEMGADVNAVFTREPSPLAAAAANGYGLIVELLLWRGANPWQKDGILENAIITAVSGGYNDVVTLLLQNRKTDHLRDSRIITDALRLACYNGNLQLVKLLLDWDPDLDQLANGGFPDYYGLNFVLSTGGFRYRTPRSSGSSMLSAYPCGHALDCAARRGHYEITKLLLDHGAAVNTMSLHFNDSALQATCVSGHQDVAALLIERGADTTNTVTTLCGFTRAHLEQESRRGLGRAPAFSRHFEIITRENLDRDVKHRKEMGAVCELAHRSGCEKCHMDIAEKFLAWRHPYYQQAYHLWIRIFPPIDPVETLKFWAFFRLDDVTNYLKALLKNVREVGRF